MKNRFIDIFGFEPTSEESQFMQVKLDDIMAEAPSRAFITVKLDKKGDIFEGLAEIFYGGDKPFVAKTNGNTLNEMILGLSHSMKDQIKEWRGQRFDFLDTLQGLF